MAPLQTFHPADIVNQADHEQSSSSDPQRKQRSRQPHRPSSILTLHTEVFHPGRQSFPRYLCHFCPLEASTGEPLHQKAPVGAGPPSLPLTQQGLNGCRAEYARHIRSFLGHQCLRVKLPSSQKASPDWSKWRKKAKSKKKGEETRDTSNETQVAQRQTYLCNQSPQNTK